MRHCIFNLNAKSSSHFCLQVLELKEAQCSFYTCMYLVQDDPGIGDQSSAWGIV